MGKDKKPKEVVVPLTEEDLYVFRQVIEEDTSVTWLFDGVDIKFIKEVEEEGEEDGTDEAKEAVCTDGNNG